MPKLGFIVLAYKEWFDQDIKVFLVMSFWHVFLLFASGHSNAMFFPLILSFH